MNKANKFKRRVQSQNSHAKQNSFSSQQKVSKFCNHNARVNTSFSEIPFQPYQIHRRVSTQHFQIEPFAEIDNFVTKHINRISQSQRTALIKTKKAKMYPKPKYSTKQKVKSIQSSSKQQTQDQCPTNFQILKKQIEDLQNLQILNQSKQPRTNNPEQSISFQDSTFDINGLYENKQYLNRQNTGYLIKGQFAGNKCLSILQKKRQNIKKMRNKKYANCFPIKKAQQYGNSFQFSTHQINLECKKQIVSNQLFRSNDFFRKKQTPQIVKRYYRPQSCNNKRWMSIQKQQNFTSQIISNTRPKSNKFKFNDLMITQNFTSQNTKNHHQDITSRYSSFSQQFAAKRYNLNVKNSQKKENSQFNNKVHKQLLIICH